MERTNMDQNEGCVVATRGATRTLVQCVLGCTAVAAAVACSSGGSNWSSSSSSGADASREGSGDTDADVPAEADSGGSPDTTSPSVQESEESGPTEPGPRDAADDTAGWTLTWSDEFNLPDGSPVDPTKWSYETGGGGWGNGEREYYTSGTANAVIQGGQPRHHGDDGGSLAIQVLVRHLRIYERPHQYLGHFSQQYGRIEASIQIPIRTGRLAGFLDARRQHRQRRMAEVRRD